MSFEKEMKTALSAVTEACGICVRAREGGIYKETKADGTPVTAADYAAQFVIVRSIARRFPADGIVAEETPSFQNGQMAEEVLKLLPEAGADEMAEMVSRGGDAERFWAIDPIDGTAGFIEGAQFAVAAALVENGEPALGILGCPGLGFIMCGARGRGVRKVDVKKAQSGKGAWEKPRGRGTVLCETARGTEEAYSVTREIMGDIEKSAGETETIRMDGQCKYALVAAGRADVFMRVPNSGGKNGRRENIWDHAAGAAVVSAAGGKVSDFYGNPLDFGAGVTLAENNGVVASAGAVADVIMEAIRKTGF